MPADASQYSSESFKPLLKHLVQSPTTFTPSDCALAFQHLCTQAASDAQAGAFLTALTLSGLESDPKVVAACAAVLREHAVRVNELETGKGKGREEDWDYEETDQMGEGYTGTVDIVGTGGDGWDTFNVSTTAAVVVAGTGVRVAKHGSKAATSSSGSADLLMTLGCHLSFPPSQLPSFLPSSPFLFLFAPHYHPALAHIAPIRRSLAFRTIFNVLGPLINPARPRRMLLGVAKKELGDTFAEVLRLLGVERALVVCGKEGLDEISPEGETWTWWLENGEITTSTLHPTTSFGLPTHPLSSVRGATPLLNSQTFLSLLDPAMPAPPPHLSSPASADSPSLPAIRDYVLMNAAALLRVSGRARDWAHGVEIARESADSGRALEAFVRFRKGTERAMGRERDVVEDDGGVAARGGEVESWLHQAKNSEGQKE